MDLKHHRKRIKYYILGFLLISIVIIGAYILWGEKIKTISFLAGEKKNFFAQSGTCGSCDWTIDNNGKLTIKSGTLRKIDYQEHPEWYPYRNSIKSVHVNSGVKTNTSCFALFQNCTNLVSANLTNLNATSATHFEYIFDGCSSLTSVTFGSNVITTNTIEMSHMFQGCHSLTSLDLSNFNTTNVTDMTNMFFNCYNLETINFGNNFRTSKVTNFNCFFGNCFHLKSVGININTSSCNNSMSLMFYSCQNLTSINLSGFNTSKVKTMNRMFYNCNGLKTLDLSTFNTNSVTDMTEMLASMDKCYEIKFGANFRFKKTGSSSVNTIITPNYYWKKSGTTESKTALLLENTTGAVTGTWHRQVTVTYYGNGGVYNNNQTNWSERATFTEKYKVWDNFYTRKGYTFAGWKDPTGVSWTNWHDTWVYDNGQYGIESGILKLYAQWTPKTYTVRYEGNGGTWNNQTSWSNTATFGQRYVVVSNDNFYVNGDKIFIGWKDPTGANWENWAGTWAFDNGDWGITNNTLVLKAQWAPSSCTVTVKHYIHKLGENKYELYDTTNFNNAYNSNVVLDNYKSIIEGFTYEQGFLGDTGVTKPTTGAITSTTLTSNITISLYYRRNYLYLKYNTNKGTLANEHGNYVDMAGEYATISSSENHLMGLYGSKIGIPNLTTYTISSDGLPNYNNPVAMNIKRSGYMAKDNAEWCILDSEGNILQLPDNTYAEYDQDSINYDANDQANDAGLDLGASDVTVILHINWQPDSYTATYNVNGGTVDPPSKVVNYDDYYGELAIPEETGYTFNGWSRLPSGYTELEYIESTGTQYIDTGYRPNPETGVKVDFQYTDLTQQQSVFAVYGDNSNSSSFSYSLYINYLSNLAYAYTNGAGNWQNTGIAANTDRHIWEFNCIKKLWDLDSGNFNALQGSATNTAINSMCLMASKNVDNTVSYYGNIKLYSFEIYEYGVLLKKFIPCKNSNNQAGLYDIVNGVFYGNSGTGTFIEGPEVFVLSSNIVDLPFNHTLYENKSINHYTIEYYHGNNGQDEEEVTLLGSSSHTYDVTANLNTYNGTAISGWEFAGWSIDGGITSTDVVYSNQQSVINLTEQNNGIVCLYAVFKRTIRFYSGVNKVTTSTEIQYYNPYITTLVSEVLAPVPSLTGLSSYGWSASGYRADTTASTATYEVTTEAIDVSPEYNVGNSSTTVNLYAVYSRPLTIVYIGNGATGGTTPNQSRTQYYNSNGTKSTASFSTRSNGFIRTGYSFSKWAIGSLSGTQVDAGQTTSFSPLYNSTSTTLSLYALWNAANYPITYDLDGGTVSPANPTTYQITTPTFSLNNPTRNGYTFVGWTGSNGTTPELSVSIAKGSTGSRSYTANWRQNKVVVNLQRDEVEWSNSGIKVALYQNGVEKYSTIVTSGTKAEFEFVEPGVYDIYAGKNSNEKVTLVDTGKDITVGDINPSS